MVPAIDPFGPRPSDTQRWLVEKGPRSLLILMFLVSLEQSIGCGMMAFELKSSTAFVLALEAM